MRITCLAVVLLSSSLALVGCMADENSQSPRSEAQAVGTLRLALDLANGSTLDQLDYAISAPDIATISGSLDVAAISGTTFTARVAGVPAGTGRTITLSGEASDGRTCQGSATFDVGPNQMSAVQVVLSCGATPRGSVDVNGSLNQCPQLAAVSAVPISVPVGSTIALMVAASDADLEPLSFAWSADSGSFSAPNAASTAFTCTAPGTFAATVSATDAAGCSDTISIQIACSAAGGECGDGTVDQGEQCDDGNTQDGDGCSATCMTEEPGAQCGDGTVDPGEQCDDGNTQSGDGCSATCTTEEPSAQCGDGTVDPGEQCDDGNTQSGDGCSATCTTEEPSAQCGDGTVDPGEQCDDGNTQSGDGCSATCTTEGEVVQLPGTWITPETTFASTIAAPVVGTADIQVAIALAIRVTPAGSISAQVCNLNLTETAMGLQFVDSPQEIQSAPTQLAMLSYDVGAAFPIENVTLSGDSLVVNATALGLNGLSVDLDVALSLNATFSASDEISGTSSVVTTGNVSLNGLPLGPLSIPATGDPPSLGFNAVRVSSDPALSCEAAAALL